MRQREGGANFSWPAKALQRRAQSETRCEKTIASRLCDAVGGFAMKPCLDAEPPMRTGTEPVASVALC